MNIKTGDSKVHLIFELICLYFLIPSIALFRAPISLKVAVILLAIFYIFRLIIKKKIIPKSHYGYRRVENWFSILFPFFLFVFASLILMIVFRKEYLFLAPKKIPWTWVFIWFIYSIFSVYPQEMLYRAFFSHRYQNILSEKGLLWLSALAFSYGHVVIHNPLAYLLTFLGGFIFMRIYKKNNSLLLVGLVHSLYGFWIFTVGVGDYFAFPMPEP